MIGTKLSRLFQGLVTSAGSPVMAHFVHNQMQFYGSIVFLTFSCLLNHAVTIRSKPQPKSGIRYPQFSPNQVERILNVICRQKRKMQGFPQILMLDLKIQITPPRFVFAFFPGTPQFRYIDMILFCHNNILTTRMEKNYSENLTEERSNSEQTDINCVQKATAIHELSVQSCLSNQ